MRTVSTDILDPTKAGLCNNRMLLGQEQSQDPEHPTGEGALLGAAEGLEC